MLNQNNAPISLHTHIYNATDNAINKHYTIRRIWYNVGLKFIHYCLDVKRSTHDAHLYANIPGSHINTTGLIDEAGA